MKLSILFTGFFFTLCKGELRISGGNEATVNKFPFATSLLTNYGSGVTFRQACGGAIITRNAILSSASCYYSDSTPHPANWWRARVGSSNSNSEGTIFLVSRITAHTSFEPDTLDNNIAVLRTRYDMELVPGLVEQAFLPGTAHSIGNNQRVQAIGWGVDDEGNRPEQLREVTIFTVDQAICAGRYSNSNVSITSNMLCAGWLDVGVRGQCEGDEGSPLLHQGTVVGVFSHAVGCADILLPGINTRVSIYSRWIIDTALAP